MVLWSSSRCPDPCPWPSTKFSFISSLKYKWIHTDGVRIKGWCALFLLILYELTTSSAQTSHHVNTHTVNTKYGYIRGLRLQFSSGATKHLDPVSAYLGIPYASPPINAYRFMPPVAPLPWSPGTRLAVSFSPACPQRFPDVSNKTKALLSMTTQRYNFLQRLIPHLANQSEDCLYLNLYVPTVRPGDDDRPGKFAIAFVIHGESWEWGSGSEFDGAVLASLGNHIVVTFNYRLGILGFLKTSNQQSNFGLLDVIAALHWVRENGDAFGGDRNRITLLGYRTGAVIANLLLVAQIAKDLFQRAILISGSVLSPWALQKQPEEIALQVSHHLGCKGRLPLSHPESDLAPCLRQKHLSDLLSFIPESPRFLSPFAPYIDNVLLTNVKLAMGRSGSQLGSNVFARAQLLIVFTTSEGIHELNDGELRHGFESEHRDRILRTLVRNMFNYHQQEIYSIVRNEYTDWERSILHPIPLRDATVEALSDSLVIAPAIQLALAHSRPKSDSTYVLHFSHVSREVDFTPFERLGSLAGDILPYTMGLPVTNNVPALGGQPYISPWTSVSNFSKQDSIVSETLIHYLANFVKSGNPNMNEMSTVARVGIHSDPNDLNGGSSSRARVRLRSLHWDAFDQITQVYMNLGVKPRLRSHYRGHKLALWLNLIPQIHLAGGTDVAPSHHVFQDNSPGLYIGPVRQLYPLSFGDQIPGFGGPYFLPVPTKTHVKQPTTTMGVTTTECVDLTGSPTFSHGIGVVGLDIEDEVNMKVSMDASPGLPMREEKPHGGYDYSTALTVTLTVGVCLILLNLVVFSAIMCQRNRGLENGLSGSASDSPGSRPGADSTPVNSPYRDEFNWTPCPSSHGVNGGENYCTGHLSHPGGEGITMGQYPPSSYAQNLDCNAHMDCCVRGGGSLMRSRNHQPCSPSPIMMVMMSTNQNMGCPDSTGRHGVQLQQIPHDFIHNSDQPPPGSIRLYMNQSAGDMMDVQDSSDKTNHRPASYAATTTNSISRTLLRQNQVQSSSSSGGTAVSTPNMGGNPSPNAGNTTLVGVLKRHNSQLNSTVVKKRVQIQEISV